MSTKPQKAPMDTEIEIREKVFSGHIMLIVLGVFLLGLVPAVAFLLIKANVFDKNGWIAFYLIGGILLTFAIVGLVWAFVCILTRHTIILTEDRMLMENFRGSVVGHILYENIAKIKKEFTLGVEPGSGIRVGLFENPLTTMWKSLSSDKDRGGSSLYVGIALLSPKRSKKNFWPNFKRGRDYDIKLFNRYDKSPEKICNLLRSRVRKVSNHLE